MARMITWALARIAKGEKGQGTVEYALVLLAVAAVAIALIAWVKSGAGRGALWGLFENVVDWVISAVTKFRP